MNMREFLKRVALARVIVACGRTLRDQFGCNARWITALSAFWRFRREYRLYRRMSGESGRYSLPVGYIQPCLCDRTGITPIDPIYFIQDTWFARCVAQRRPAHHVDVGSSAKTMALVAQFIPVTMIDIRPVPLEVPGFSFKCGSILALPFADGSVPSLSSICVIEHIGLGRYGDDLDPEGSEKAAVELQRVLARGGDLYVSVPVDNECRVYFNAHRAFTRDAVLELFSGLELASEQYLYGFEVLPTYAPLRGFGTGMYHFCKP